MHAALTVLLALTLAAPSTAPVVNKPKPATAAASALAILPIGLAGGAADDTLRAQLLTHLQSGLARGAFTLVDPAKLGEVAPGDCTDHSH